VKSHTAKAMRLRLAAVLLLVPTILWATTVIPLSVEKLASLSSHVIEGRAIASTSQWNAEHTLIFTYTQFAVTRTLKGQAPATVMVRQLGGTVDGVTQKVSGVHQIRVGDESLLFLQPSQLADGALVITGLMQGNFVMRHTPEGKTVVSNGMPEASEYRPSTGQVTSYRGSNLRLEELESRVQKAVQK
jgi:hypothetical protein